MKTLKELKEEINNNPNTILFFYSNWLTNIDFLIDKIKENSKKYKYNLILLNIEEIEPKILTNLNVEILPTLFVINKYIIREIFINDKLIENNLEKTLEKFK